MLVGSGKTTRDSVVPWGQGSWQLLLQARGKSTRILRLRGAARPSDKGHGHRAEILQGGGWGNRISDLSLLRPRLRLMLPTE